ncbi:MAG: hypothetical protein ACI8RZ_000783, partial [Myxococcota bacterium]
PAPEQEAVARYSRVITGEVYTSSQPEREGDSVVYEDRYSGYQAQMLPAVGARDHDLSEVIFDPSASGAAQEAAEADAARLLCWDALPWERLSLKVHLRFAQVCKGDVLILTINNEGFYGALTETRYGFSDQAVLVANVRTEMLPPEGPVVWLDLLTVTIPIED